MTERKCDDCGELTQRKYLGKIGGKFLCKKCRSKLRIAHREKTIKDARIHEDLKELSLRQKKEYNDAWRKKDKRKRILNQKPSKIKGSIKKKIKLNSYLTLQEKQGLFRILIKRGLKAEEVKERIGNISLEQIRIRKLMKQQNKSDGEIKIKQQELLEELWRS